MFSESFEVTDVFRRAIAGMEDQRWNADFFTSGLVDGGYRERWQTAVDVLYRFIKGGVIWLPELIPERGVRWNDECAEYVTTLARRSPFSGDLDDYFEWKRFEFRLSDWVLQIASEKGWEEGWESISKELCERFEEAGVGLERGVLIPVQ